MRALQTRYPCGGPTFAISDVHLRPEALIASPRTYSRPGKHLVFVGSLEQLYKSPDVLIDGVARLCAAGLDLTLTMIGDGRFRQALQTSASAAALGSRLTFLGWLPAGDAVRTQLDRADVFVLPSRTEGLPRALVEAMARGLPCVGSRVGGIPELLPREYLVEPGNSVQLADVIARLVTAPARLSEASARNLERARRFSHSVLGPRRREFYRTVLELTALSMSGRSPSPPTRSLVSGHR